MSAVMARSRHRGNRFKRSWTAALIVERIQQWAKLYGEAPRFSDWDSYHQERNALRAESLALDWRRRQSVFRAGDWPAPDRVRAFFGTWNAAIEAAGLSPRSPGQRTKRGEIPSPFLIPLGQALDEAYAAEHEGDVELLRASLLRVASIARRLAKELP